MKKVLFAVVSALLVAVMAVSAVACAKKERMKVVDVMLTGEQYCFAVNNDKAGWLDTVNSVVEKLVGDEPYNPELDPTTDAVGVTYDYNGDGVAEENVTLKTLYDAEADGTIAESIGEVKKSTDGLDRKKCLVVATNAEFEPFEYFSGDSYAGIDMHVARIMAQELGLELVILDMEFDVVIQNVSEGMADMGMAGLTYNETRAKMVTFSEGYYGTTQRIAVRESDYHLFENCKNEADVRAVIEGMGNIQGGAADGQSGYAYIVGDTNFGDKFVGFDNVEAKGYPSIALAVSDLAVGKVRFVAADKDSLQAAVDDINATISAE